MESRFEIKKVVESRPKTCWLKTAIRDIFGQKKCLCCGKTDDYFSYHITVKYDSEKNITEFFCTKCGNYGKETGTILEIYERECGYVWREPFYIPGYEN